MNLVNFLSFSLSILAIISLSQCKDEIDNDISIPEAISSTTATNLDANLRKALLQALSELENEEISKTSKDDEAAKSIFFSSTTRSPEDHIVEKAPASAISILANSEIRVDNSKQTTNNENKETENNSQRSEDTEKEPNTEKPIVIIQKSAGFEHRPIISVLNDRNEENEALSLSASSSFTDNQDDLQSSNNFVRSSAKPNLGPNSVSVNDKSFTPGVKSVSITPKYETTTQIPTTSTAENEAKVEDVQFFSAPLVAAFTVHQDERGLPNKVEPIYKQAGQTAISATEIVDKERQELLRREEIKREEYRRKLLAEAKQKALEQQVHSLQEQQKKQQEYLLRQQRIIQEQQLQHQRLIQEQHRLNHNDRPFVPIINNSPSTTERSVFFTTNNANNFNNFQSLPDANQKDKFKHFAGTIQITTPNPLSSASSSNLPPNRPNFFQDLPVTTPNPQLFSQNLNVKPFNNFGTFNQHPPNQFNNFDPNFNAFNNLNNFNKNFNNFINTPNANKFNNNHNNKQNTLVNLQSSLSLSPSDLQSGKLPLNAQILPVRNAIDFLQSPNPNSNFNLRPPTFLNQQQQVFSNTFTQQPQQQFQQFPNNFVQSLPNIRQGTRVFRQESNTGNLGFNNFNKNNFNDFNQNHHHPSFNIQQSLEPPNRFFRSNAESFHQSPGFGNKPVFQPQNANQQLNSLLYHSGITRNVRQNDDLHIVSKILSYNLGRDNLFTGSRVNEQRVPKH